ILVQLPRRGPTGETNDPDASKRNLLYQRVRETQRAMARGALDASGDVTPQAEAGRHLVVTHDLPLHPGDGRHLAATAQLELGRRVALAVRDHLLGEGVDGSGPQLQRVEKVSNTLVRVHTDRAVAPPGTSGPDAYSGYFRLFSGGAAVPVTFIERDPVDTRVIRLGIAATPGAVEVRYMPPPAPLNEVALDVVRSATCTEPMPGTSACLPMAAFGAAVTEATLTALRLLYLGD
nr:hypothetical protein [Trueperaceae bacterium]